MEKSMMVVETLERVSPLETRLATVFGGVQWLVGEHRKKLNGKLWAGSGKKGCVF
jgi:hypothetical protein